MKEVNSEVEIGRYRRIAELCFQDLIRLKIPLGIHGRTVWRIWR